MTTEFIDNKIWNFKVLLSWRFPRKKQKKKNSVLDDFPLCPQGPPSLKKRKFYFYCRLAVSEARITRFARITRISDSRESPDSRESCESIRANHATKGMDQDYPDLPFLAFSISLLFSLQGISLLFLSVFPFFPRDLRGSAERKILAFLGGFPCFSPKKSKKRKIRVRGMDH